MREGGERERDKVRRGSERKGDIPAFSKCVLSLVVASLETAVL